MDHQSVVCSVRFSPDGSMLATGCHKAARVFDVKTGERKFMVSRHGGTGSNGNASSEEEGAYVRAVAFSPDCTKLVAGMPHNTIRVWDIASNEEGPAMTGHESEIYALDYIDDMIVSGSGDRKVRLWDARTGVCQKVFGSESGGPSDGVTSVALSPDGRYLAAGSLDKVVRMWDTETSQLLDRFEGHSDSVYSIAFSPDGKNVISGSLDKNIMLWDVNAQGRTTSRPRMVFQGHKDFVLSVAYTPDGRCVCLLYFLVAYHQFSLGICAR
jgi:general transcriptional corepressor TUP1